MPTIQLRPRILPRFPWAFRLTRAPAVIWIPAMVVGVSMLLPLIYLVIRTTGAGAEVLDLLIRSRTMWVTLRTLALAIVVTSASAVVALPLAWLTTRTNLPFRKIWSVLTILPLVIPSYVGALVIVAALGPRGMLQQLLEAYFGLKQLPNLYGFLGAAIALTLFTYPYMLLSLRAALRGLDPSMEEASRSLGMNSWHTFTRIILPQLRPALGAGFLLVALYTLSDFGAVSLLRFESLTQQIYVQYQSSFSRHMAAAFSLLLGALTLTLLLAEARARGSIRYHKPTTGTARPPVTLRLGFWQWPAVIYCGVIVSLGLLLPVGVLVYWLVIGLMSGEPLRLFLVSAWNSLHVSTLAAVVTVAAALPVAILVVRFPGWLTSTLDRTTYIGFAMPGIVVALALVFFGANFAPAIYQTMAILVFAYLILFLPQAAGTLRVSMLQVNPRLEEMGRSLGKPFAWVLFTVTIPLLRPGILAGAALVFLTTMKELPATLLLSPIGFQTLATKIWGATAEGFFARAAAPSLLLILLASLPLIWLLRSESNVRP